MTVIICWDHTYCVSVQSYLPRLTPSLVHRGRHVITDKNLRYFNPPKAESVQTPMSISEILGKIPTTYTVVHTQ